MIDNSILKDKAKSLPENPGVYLMKDSLQNIIYVGKAKNLKNRVRSYFYNLSQRSSKIEKLLLNIRDFEFYVTDTELDALLLECKLIRDLKPPYNTLLKNPNVYSYIKIDYSREFPTLEATLEKEDKNSIYFGPYNSFNATTNLINIIKDIYPIIRCEKSYLNKRICLNYAINPCKSICDKCLSPEEYKTNIEEVQSILKGDTGPILMKLNKSMGKAAEDLNFEEASKIRDNIKLIYHIKSINEVIEESLKNKLLIAVQDIDDSTSKVFIIKGNKLIFDKKIDKESINEGKLRKYALEQIEKKDVLKEELKEICKEDLDEQHIIYSYIKNKKNNMHYIEICLDEGKE
ncbi:GIY-YIG nuclease family protein [Clostridium sp. MSJ-4]|uniref:GIY-YIG nuclease family protein n=1 Tax=Clostridium simiarum TaxID=2841506 RepID=A0ABS6F2Y1_9CLOT|nr:GIY-YIG nuclease family protein [Clostridium simiarum]MBU5591968.1 GIY-YIG nuclease family protein [Clostridium simiarum]